LAGSKANLPGLIAVLSAFGKTLLLRPFTRRRLLGFPEQLFLLAPFFLFTLIAVIFGAAKSRQSPAG
jgi:hypothetical protein